MSIVAPSHPADLHPGPRSPIWSMTLGILLMGWGFVPSLGACSSLDDRIDNPPDFNGARTVIAANQQIHISWDPARDDHTLPEQMIYRIFLASRSGKHDFDTPSAITSAGATTHTIVDLPDGEPQFVVVRAIDEQGQSDDNEYQWPALPNPVLYVDDNAEPGGDGTSAEKPLQTIDQAIGEAIGLPGVNIHVAAGRYSEQLLLFEGMAIYGGFPPGFTGPSDPAIHLTILSGKPQRDVLIIPPGQRLVVIDGFSFDGANQARRAIVADDCLIRISHCQIHSFRDKGIQIETDRDEDGASLGVIHHCTFSNNGGDGVRIEGFIDLALRDCTLVENGQSGISVSPMLPRIGEKARIEMERCVISRNHDVGLSIRIDAPLGGGEDPARVRIGLRGILVQGNHDHGASIDVRYPENALVDLRIRIEQSSFLENSLSGIHIDADAPGDLSISECSFLGNRGEESILVTGDSTRALTRIRSCLIAAGPRFGVRLMDIGLLDVSRCLFVDNGGPSIFVSDQQRLRARMWACSGIGASPRGTRIEGADLRNGAAEARPGYVSVREVLDDSVRIEIRDWTSLPATGFLLDPLGDRAISFEYRQGNRLLLTGGAAKSIQLGSVWLISTTEKHPPWSEFIEKTSSPRDDGKGPAAPPGLDYPGISRLHSAPHRPLDVIAVDPAPAILPSGRDLQWRYTLTKRPTSVPEILLTMDGKKMPVRAKLAGEVLEVTSLTDLAAGGRIRIEWNPEPETSGDGDRISHEWLIAGDGGG